MEYIHFVLFIYRYVHHQLFKNISMMIYLTLVICLHHQLFKTISMMMIYLTLMICLHHQLQNDIDDDDILNSDDLFTSPTIQKDIDDSDDPLPETVQTDANNKSKQNDAINKLNIEVSELKLQLFDKNMIYMQLQEKDDIIERLEEEIKQSNLEKYKQKYEA
eukprot:63322_1